MSPFDDRSMTPAPMPAVKYTPEEKTELLALLEQVWSLAPELRLGQLLCCAVGYEKILFACSDLELQKALAEFRDRVRR